ncbi:MAG: NAD(P)/FAD-dependent oxidoreductase [Armatimonadota bacterium]
MANQSVVVIGAGPAGLAAGRELALAGVDVTVLEREDVVGGLSRTVEHEGYRFDIGGHRFFTKLEEVERVWDEIMGEDFLARQRLSRIFYRGRLMDYPLSVGSTLRTLGLTDSLLALSSYLWARLRPVPEESFEGWVVNRFGRRLYEHFFKTYTEKVWGMPCTEISADWAAQRIKSLSLWGAVRDALLRRGGKEATTLIRQFKYPRLGPGQLYGRYRDQILNAGGEVATGRRAARVLVRHGSAAAVVTESEEGEVEHEADAFISSMPLGELIAAMQPQAPEGVREAAARLRHRAFITAALILDQPDPFPDQWIYIHEPDVRVGRVQNYRNWSPDMVPDEGRCCVGAEYFTWTHEPLWSETDEAIIDLARAELDRLRLANAAAVVDGRVMRMEHAYPVYDPGYRARVATVRSWLDEIENLQTIGRGGQHRYNNMDHAVMTGMLAARNVLGEANDVWAVNVEEEHLERT